MKYKIIGICVFVACIISAFCVTLYFAQDDEQKVRYHEHLERSAYTSCNDHGDDVFCTHLPILEIDTNGQIIPGRDLAGLNSPLTILEKTPDGKDEIIARVKTIAQPDQNHHLGDEYDLESDAIVHVRGRSSRNFDKLGYAVDFIDEKGEDSALPFLGMDPHKEWALHGPFLDKSLIRNYMWYNIGGEIMEYAPNCRFCEVFINGEYKGLYLAVEKITAGENGARLTLKKNSKDNSFSGYILKYDGESDVPIKNLNTFTTYTQFLENSVSVVYPKGKNITPELAEEITREFSKFEKALYSYDYDDEKLGYKAYIDMASFVDFFIINEFTSNYDAGNRSTYFYMDLNGRYKTCIWDFDACCGNYIKQTDEDYYNLVTRPWFARLILDEDFNEAVIERYWELRKNYLSEDYLIEYIDETISYLGKAVDRNWQVWGYTMAEDYKLLSPSERNLHSFDEAVAQLKNYISDRLVWMDKNIDSLRRYSAESAVKNNNENAK